MQTYNLWEDSIPLFDETIDNQENKNCCQVDAYLVEGDKNKKSAMVILGGGGYGLCSKTEGTKMAKWLNDLGINTFVVRYRVAPYRYPACLLDAKRAMRFVRYNADKFNIDPNKIGLVGFSAGGHLAGMVCEFFDKFDDYNQDEIDKISAKPDLAVLGYPVISLCESYAHQGSANNLVGDNDELKKMLSLENNIREDMPEMFLWHTLEDTTVSALNTINFSFKLKENNIAHSLHIFNNGPHAIVLAEDIEETRDWPKNFKTTLEKRKFI